MSGIIKAKEYFLSLVSAAVQEKPLPMLPEDLDFSKLYRLAVNNAVQSILYLSLDNKNSIPEDYRAKMRNTYMAELMRDGSQDEEIKLIRKKFSEDKIDYILLKGSHLKSLYPASQMRFMVDMDILIREKDLEKAKKEMLARGFEQKMDNGKDIVMIKKPFLTIELHKSLFVEKDSMHTYFSAVWERAEKVSEYEYKMSDSDMYVYVLAHLAEHYMSAGSCFRPMMDLYLMEKKLHNSLDFDYINGQFKIIGIDKFACNIQRLCKSMFENPSDDETLSMMENYIVLGPPVKNAEAASKSAVTGNSKLKIILKTVFPPFRHMAAKFPILKKFPFLLPIYWAVRFLKYLFSKDERIAKRRESLKNSDKKSSDIMEQIFKKSGL